MTMNKILIGSPVHQKPEILEQFLISLKRLNKDEIEIHYLFIDDNEDENSSKLLNEFPNNEKNVTIYKDEQSASYVCDEGTHRWNESLVWKVAGFKDMIIAAAIEQGYDYLFLIDSDLVFHPKILNRLIEVNKDIVSDIFWTNWREGKPKLPQVWLKDFYTQYQFERGEQLSEDEISKRHQEFLDKMSQPGTYEVGGLGACTLISRNALEKGVYFKEIKNLSFWGEDRHFCIRAAALGIPLFVDTYYPAYHIYRMSDLEGVKEYIEENKFRDKKIAEMQSLVEDNYIETKKNSPFFRIAKPENNKLTLSMIIKNEANKYLMRALFYHREYIDNAVIIDDGSTDNSIEVCQRALRGIPTKIIKNDISKFSNEVILRKQQWEETLATEPDWILNLDADEIFEEAFKNNVRQIINQQDYDVIMFRLYDMWDEEHYREDQYWRAQFTYRPFLVRYQKNFNYKWKETEQHCGRFPQNITDLPFTTNNMRLKHYGWAREKDRKEKYDRYMKLDPEAKYGWKEQYESILDGKPNLVKWEE